MVPVVRPLRQLLLSPTAFFEERPPAETLSIGIGLVVLLTIASVVAIMVIGSLLAGAVDATVTMENPDRPSETFCEIHGDDPDSAFADSCAEPKTIERDAGELVREAVDDYLWLGIAPLLMWILGTVVLFASGRLADGSPSLSGTAALAGWAALPEFVRLAAGVGGLWFVLRDTTITDPERGAAVLQAAIAPVEPVLLAVSVLTVAWQWSLLTGGLSRDADLPWGTAGVAVGIPLGVVFLLGVL